MGSMSEDLGAFYDVRAQIRSATLTGTRLDEIAAELIEPAAVGDDDKDALRLYAWSLDKPVRAERAAFLDLD